MIDLQSITAGGTTSGVLAVSDVDSLRKALEAGYGTDVAGLTGGGALRVQSLDATMQAILADQSHFALFNALPKPAAGATVDEWTEATSQGGFPGSSFNGEAGAIAQAQGEYARRVGLVKYLMTKCEVSFVTTLQNAMVNAEAQENQMGTLRLLRDAEHAMFYGDSAVVPTEFDGIIKLVNSLNSADHVIDAEGASLASVNGIAQAAATISGIDAFGVPTDLFLSPKSGADLDINLDPAYRVALASGAPAQLGTPVRGVVTAHGDVAVKRDVFLQDEDKQVPFELQYPAIAAANAFVPQSITGATASDASSKFGATHAGNYYYAGAGITNAGQSNVVKSAAVAVAAGEKVTLTITASVAGTETGYAIYRGRKNGTNATSDLRLMARVAKAGGTTTYVDLNRQLPGASTAVLMNLSPAYSAAVWRQLLPLTKFQLYPVAAATVPWALLLFGYLRVSKRQQHVVIKNIVPSAATWKPFG
ncbi:MAG: hypothetical protein RL456_3605 [Pseudomonadota bacterium]|jgi:hypothetical protein